MGRRGYNVIHKAVRSHPFVPGPASPLAGGPARPKHVSGLAVDAIGRANPEHTVGQLVYPRGAHVRIELGDWGGDIAPHDEVRRDGVAPRIPRPEDAVHLTDGELAVRCERVARPPPSPPAARDGGVRLHRDPATGEAAAGERHERGL